MRPNDKWQSEAGTLTSMTEAIHITQISSKETGLSKTRKDSILAASRANIYMVCIYQDSFIFLVPSMFRDSEFLAVNAWFSAFHQRRKQQPSHNTPMIMNTPFSTYCVDI